MSSNEDYDPFADDSFWAGTERQAAQTRKVGRPPSKFDQHNARRREAYKEKKRSGKVRPVGRPRGSSTPSDPRKKRKYDRQADYRREKKEVSVLTRAINNSPVTGLLERVVAAVSTRSGKAFPSVSEV